MKAIFLILLLAQATAMACKNELGNLAGGDGEPPKKREPRDVFDLGGPELGPLKDSNGGPVNFLTADWAMHQRWQKHRPLGTSFEDAKQAMMVDSYKTSKEISRYDLTPEQEFQVARVAARNHGAVFSELVKHYPRLTELQRYQLAMIAARFNSWGNVEFDIDAFGITNPEWRLNLIRRALKRSDHQIEFLGKWGLDRDALFGLYELAARQHGMQVLNHLEPLGKLSPKEKKALYLAIALGKDSYHITTNFDASMLPRIADRFEIAMILAARNRYFPEHISKFALPEEDPRYRQVVQTILDTKENRALRYPKELGLGDRELFDAYIKMRDRDSLVQPNMSGEGPNYAHWEKHDPLDLIESVAKDGRKRPVEFPDFERPGAPEEEGFGLTIMMGDQTIFDSKTADLLADPPPNQFDDVAKFSKAHPELLPKKWVEAAWSTYQNRILATELLRQCYRQSTKDQVRDPKDSLDIAFRAAGLPSAGLTATSYDRVKGFNFHVELLSLAHTFDKPAFQGIAVDPRLYQPENVQRFTKFLHDIRMRLHHDSKGTDMYEWDAWLRLSAKLKLGRTGITPENIDALTAKFAERPRLGTHKKLPPLPPEVP